MKTRLHSLILILILGLIPILGFSQCPPDSTFNSQTEIDALATDYPDCTSLGDLLIEGNDITNLSGLAQIVRCTKLSITNNPIITSLDGLYPNLEVGGEFEYDTSVSIDNNSSLTSISAISEIYLNFVSFANVGISDNPSLSGLDGIQFVSDRHVGISISNNDALTNLAGINNLGNQEYLSISGNDNLIDFTGLGSVSDLEALGVANNASLQSFNGANINNCNFQSISISNNPNLTDISSGFGENNSGSGALGNNLVIKNNLNLSVCNVEVICYKLTGDYDSGMMFFDIQNNASGCNSIQEIEYSCGIPPSNDDCVFGYYDDIIANNYPMWLELGETVIANDEFATESYQLPSCNDVENRIDLWFFFNSGENTTIDLITDAGYSLQLWEGGCMSLVQVENACGSAILSNIPVTTNTLYSVQVWNDVSGKAMSGFGWFDLLVQTSTLSNPEFALDVVRLFPNPTNNVLNFKATSTIDSIKVYDLLGQEVFDSTPNSNNSSIDISGFNQGLFLVSVTIDGTESTYRVIKQ